ncbi:hypothetical protein YC2023_077808 [Brassica napus]
MPSRGIIMTIKTGVADRAGGPTSCNSDSHLGSWGQWGRLRSLRLGCLLHNITY